MAANRVLCFAKAVVAANFVFCNRSSGCKFINISSGSARDIVSIFFVKSSRGCRFDILKEQWWLQVYYHDVAVVTAIN